MTTKKHETETNEQLDDALQDLFEEVEPVRRSRRRRKTRSRNSFSSGRMLGG